MTATQAPTPGPLDSESVKLLVKGDLLRHEKYGLAHFYDECGGRGEGWIIVECLDGKDAGCRPENLTFISRPDADGWMPWSGGENPVPGQVIDYMLGGNHVYSGVPSDRIDWFDGDDPIIAFRLAPTAPVEASGSELHPATADLVDRFAAELKSKLAKAESKYGYRDEWLKPDWQDELTKSLAEHIQKGDPRDVAAYCAFAWHHEWSVTPNINWKAEWEAVCSARIADRDRSQEIINERDAWIAELLQQAKVTTPARAEAQDPYAEGRATSEKTRADEEDCPYANGTNQRRDWLSGFRGERKPEAQDEALTIIEQLLAHSGARVGFDAMKHGDAVKAAEAFLNSARSPGHTDLMVTPESIDAFVEHNSPAQDEGAAGELKPCPFCGGEAEIIHLDDGDNAGGSCVCCTKCQASGNVEFGRKENFVENWNRRAHPSPTPAADEDRVRIAVEALERIADRPGPGATYTKGIGEQPVDEAAHMASIATEALAALKSTAAKEGGAL